MPADLVVNAMFKDALQLGRVTVNNPAIWRPNPGIQDAVTAYVRAVEAAADISGTFNIASMNVTLGGLADQVVATLRRTLSIDPELTILHHPDIRNYKVSGERARVTLGFAPEYDIDRIVAELVAYRAEFADFDNPAYSNIATFRAMTRDQLFSMS